MSRPTSKFKWRAVLPWKEHVLSVATVDSSKWYATIKHMYDPKGNRWFLTMRGGGFWIPLDCADEKNPPKEYVESLVLLAHDIGVNDG